jgi:hypothetical protein
MEDHRWPKIPWGRKKTEQKSADHGPDQRADAAEDRGREQCEQDGDPTPGAAAAAARENTPASAASARMNI